MTAGIGHNTSGGASIKSLIDRIENLEQSKAEVAEMIREVYAEAKSNGLDTKALRAIVKRRAQDPDKLKAHEAYRHALGDFVTSPLGAAAMTRVRGGAD
jgi:uncharacterized protein (UPF0335 family)